MQRRHLFQALAAAPLAVGAPCLWAAAEGRAPDARFLFVFLRGGADTLSLLSPTGSSFLAQVRPSIAVAGGLPVDADWALHPALAGTLLPLVRAGQCNFVPFAGSDDLSRSHFHTQDSIEYGQDARLPQRDFTSGFLNRLAQQTGAGADAIAFTDQLPIALRGSLPVANQSLKGRPRAADAALRPGLEAMYRGTPLQERVDESFATREQVARSLAEPAGPMAREMQAASRGAIDARGFEAEARRIGRLMRERYAIGFVDVGGWDTHVQQGGAQGQLASRFEELGRGLAGFVAELGEPAWRRTVVVVASEFGRTVRENGNRGTDHGRGGVVTVLGGALAAPPVAGPQQRIEAGTLFQNRDLPVLTEIRGLMAHVFTRQFGLSAAAVDAVFPGVQVPALGLL